MSAEIPWSARVRILLGAIRSEARFVGLDFVAWLLCGRRIRGGVFRGMRYLRFGLRMSISPKVLGTYEADLIPIMHWVMRTGFDRIVNIGSAEGYYAVGLARASKAVRVDAFEIVPGLRVRLARNAEGNGVDAQIVQHGAADTATLRRVLEKADEPFVLVDIEGGENDLLDPAEVPALGRVWLLVELHPGVCPGVEETLRPRFAASHRIFRFDAREWTKQRPEGAGVTPFHWLARWACFRQERRVFQTPWLLMMPHTATHSLDRAVVQTAHESARPAHAANRNAVPALPSGMIDAGGGHRETSGWEH